MLFDNYDHCEEEFNKRPGWLTKVASPDCVGIAMTMQASKFIEAMGHASEKAYSIE